MSIGLPTLGYKMATTTRPIEEPITERDKPARARVSRPAKKAARPESDASSSEESSDSSVYVIPHKRNSRRNGRNRSDPSFRDQGHEASRDPSVSAPTNTWYSNPIANSGQSSTDHSSRGSAQSRSSVSDWRSTLEPQDSISRPISTRDTTVSRSGGSNLRLPDSQSIPPAPNQVISRPDSSNSRLPDSRNSTPLPNRDISRSSGSSLGLPGSPGSPLVPSQDTSWSGGSNLRLSGSPSSPPVSNRETSWSRDSNLRLPGSPGTPPEPSQDARSGLSNPEPPGSPEGSPEPQAQEESPVTQPECLASRRPKRRRKAPERYGEWV